VTQTQEPQGGSNRGGSGTGTELDRVELFDLFISYGRIDSKVFATKLHNRLQKLGYQVWFDQEDIPLGVDFQEQIDDGLGKSDNFVFIISPHSVNSSYCAKEIALALEYRKRIIPILHVEEISQATWHQRNPQGNTHQWLQYKAEGRHSSFVNMPREIGKINWIYGRETIDDFERVLINLQQLLQHHQGYVYSHTTLLHQALTWERHQRQDAYLLIGEVCQQAKAWLTQDFELEQPPCIPTDLHCEFIGESLKYSQNNQTQVYLAYGEQDGAIAEQIYRALLRQAWTIWTRTIDLNTSTGRQREIEQAIEGTDNLVCLLSPDALATPSFRQELAHGFKHNKRVILLQVKPLERQPSQSPTRKKTVRD
jgi:hypothetical protein